MAELVWKRSSYSSSGGDACVECAAGGSVMWIRDSKDRGGRRLEVSWPAWRAFVSSARS